MTSNDPVWQAIRDEATLEARARYRLSRVGSGSVATAVSTLWLLPQIVIALGSEEQIEKLKSFVITGR